MSWFSDRTGIHLGNVGAPIGALLGSVVPGVGTALGAGLGQAIGGIGHGDGLAKSAAQGVGVYAGGKALGSVLGGAKAGSAGGGGIGGAIKGALPSVGGLGQFLGGQGGIAGIIGKYGAPALMAAQGLNAAHLGQQSSQYAKGALDSVNKSYDERAPLRARGIASMMNPQTPDMGGLASVAGNNPYAPKPAAAMAAPSPSGMQVSPGQFSAFQHTPGGALAKLRAMGTAQGGA